MDNLLELNNLSVRFAGAGRGGVVALHDVSLSVTKGEFLVVVGASGCGKSTLLRVIAGLIRATGGSVQRETNIARKGGIGMVFQDASLLEWRRVVRNVTFSGQILKMDKEASRLAAIRLLNLVGLNEFHDAYPRQLSGGMRQRVAICRALLPDPPLLLMDEPFGALDAITREKMNELLQQVWQETRKTIVFVTHSIEEAAFLSDRVVVMAQRGTIAKILSNPLPRPRDTSTYRSPVFTEFAATIRGLIMSEDVIK